MVRFLWGFGFDGGFTDGGVAGTCRLGFAGGFVGGVGVLVEIGLGFVMVGGFACAGGFVWGGWRSVDELGTGGFVWNIVEEVGPVRGTSDTMR